jgi:long-subunit acyl-CoA synthetase (AMP-forming)
LPKRQNSRFLKRFFPKNFKFFFSFKVAVVDERLVPLWLNFVPTLKFLITINSLSKELASLAKTKGIQTLTLKEIEKEGKKREVDVSTWTPPTPDDIYTLVYTSGTTGPPKGAIYKHKTMINAVAAEFVPPPFGIKRTDTDYCYMPFAHSYTSYVSLRHLR